MSRGTQIKSSCSLRRIPSTQADFLSVLLFGSYGWKLMREAKQAWLAAFGWKEIHSQADALGLQMLYKDVHCIFLLVLTCHNSAYSILGHVLQSQCKFH